MNSQSSDTASQKRRPGRNNQYPQVQARKWGKSESEKRRNTGSVQGKGNAVKKAVLNGLWNIKGEIDQNESKLITFEIAAERGNRVASSGPSN